MEYIGRFAPSPTGPLHYGSLVAALASYLDARHAGGKWLVRMEDLDPPRESKTAPREILSQLRAFGFTWDDEVLFQSTRLNAYAEALNRLRGLTYACVCTRKSPPVCTCRHLVIDPARPHAIRVRLAEGSVAIDDGVFGHRTWQLGTEVGDFIVKRKDGLFAYQLAVVVDDVHQSVTRIVRGADLLDSTPKQLSLHDLLRAPRPDYLHLPVLTDGSGQKLSKQAHAKPLSTRNPEAVLRLALADLGQDTRADCSGAVQILDGAARAWNPARIPRRTTMSAPDAML